jgi:CPA1 family monovalent cation:H+ antiporter
LEALVQEPSVPDEVAKDLRALYAVRTGRFATHAAGASDGNAGQRAVAYDRLRQELLAAERAAVVDLRQAGVISEEALRRLQHDLDVEQVRLEA